MLTASTNFGPVPSEDLDVLPGGPGDPDDPDEPGDPSNAAVPSGSVPPPTSVDPWNDSVDDEGPDVTPGATPGATPRSSARSGMLMAWASAHPALQLTVFGVAAFTVVFGKLAIRHHSSFGTWSFDMGIYDQGYWLLSRGAQFDTVRGLKFFGQHTNFVAYFYAPFYWLGAGPGFLYVSQALALGLGAIPVYLIARDRLRSVWLGLGFAVAYLLYPAIQWISWANYHPEALVITPFLYAWWFAIRGYWRAYWVAVLLALITREDTALAVFVLGLVLMALAWSVRHHDKRRWKHACITTAVGAGYYLFATKVFIPWFNYGAEPFYVKYFYGHWCATTRRSPNDLLELTKPGADCDSMGQVLYNVIRHPDKVVSDAQEKTQTLFYRQLFLPLGGTPLIGLGFLAMAGPQMLAAIIGSTPYARSIMYQYTSVMIAPIFIASIEGVARIMRTQKLRRFALGWILVSAVVANIAWSPSPVGNWQRVWGQPDAASAELHEALKLVPKDASVTATFTMLPHLAHRERAYDWPNPWVNSYWGNETRDASGKVSKTFPPPRPPNDVAYIVINRTHVGEQQQVLFQTLIAPNGEFKILYDKHDVVIARRVRKGPGTGLVDDTAPVP